MMAMVVAMAIAIAIDFTIDLDSVGGYTGRGYGAIAISSEGWLVASRNGGLTRNMSGSRTSLSAAEIASLHGAVAKAIAISWPATNNSAHDDGCCGRVKWTLRMQRRGGDNRAFVTTWYDGQEQYLPPEIAALRKLAVDWLTRANEARRRGGQQ
jgi:hypothetical protein